MGKQPIPEGGLPLSERGQNRVRSKLHKGLWRVSNALGQSTSLHSYYLEGRRKTKKPLARSIRLLVNDFQPERENDGHKTTLHPDALAAETGLIIGATVAKEALTNTEYDRFCIYQAREFELLREKHLPIIGRDLEDVLRASGRNYANYLRNSPLGNLVDFRLPRETPNQIRRDALYADAVGAMVTATEVHLISLATKREQRRDSSGRADLVKLANQIGAHWEDPSFEIPLQEL